jgi:hypothetical protein
MSNDLNFTTLLRISLFEVKCMDILSGVSLFVLSIKKAIFVDGNIDKWSMMSVKY